jgi:CTD small phosphatase-like protein 2
VPSPYITLGLPPSRDLTLVLDLDETLVHYVEVPGTIGKYLTRPYAHEFLKRMNALYELVIFTAAMQDYADWVLDDLDKDHLIHHRLYRQHATPKGIVFLKDLSRIGRDVSKTIIVDNVAENFLLHPDNGISI